MMTTNESQKKKKKRQDQEEKMDEKKEIKHNWLWDDGFYKHGFVSVTYVVGCPVVVILLHAFMCEEK